MAFCTSRTGEVVALALADGQERWRARINGKSPVLAGCAYTGRRLYTVSSDGYLAVLDPSDGKLLEKLGVNDPAKPGAGLTASTPQVASGRVVVGTETGGLRCLVGSEVAP
jgi:outer membrane protein assembly factor BamB